MKKIIKISLLACVAVVLMSACKKDGENTPPVYMSYAAYVINPEGGESVNFDFVSDKGNQFHVERNDIGKRYADDQRIIPYYHILQQEGPADGDYEFRVQLVDCYEILTKEVIQPEDGEDFGDDPVAIDHMWIANDFLTVNFIFWHHSSSIVHRINLVENDSYTDGRVHLDLLHDAEGDLATRRAQGLVSFKLESLQERAPTGQTKLDLVIHHVLLDGTEVAKPIEYKFGSTLLEEATARVTGLTEVQ